MAKQQTRQPTFGDELESLKDYIRSESKENAKRDLLFPLFKKLFKDKVKSESDAAGADVYVEGQLIVECKSDHSQWLEGFYQALHYRRKHGLTYNTIIVLAHNFVAIWKLNKLPEYAVILSNTSDPVKAPNTVGKENAKRTQKAAKLEIQQSAFYWLTPKDMEGDIFDGARNLTTESFEILKILRNLDSDRVQINTHNFIQTIEAMKPFFGDPIDAVHAFYTMVYYWGITSVLAENEENEARLIGYSGQRFSDPIIVSPNKFTDFKRFVESKYVFTNEGSGLTVDYYFSRFDEVMASIDPEYVKQHGIFFTDSNLSKFALWFAKYHFPGNVDENYVVFDPAGGSGNLVSSWRGKLKHKIISELQPDLLRTIERRMKADPFHIETGFTIVPRTSDNQGLNFLDRNAADYLTAITTELHRKNVTLDKPIAFLLNPPYKNTDENEDVRIDKDSAYVLHPSIIELTGEDASKERYLAFLGQILNISKLQAEQGMKPLVMIFTPTSWLIPRPTYVPFRKHWDKHFSYHSGFLVTSNEFFKLDGRWPLAFTIWHYREDNDTADANSVKVLDLTELKHRDLNINWLQGDENIDRDLNSVVSAAKMVTLDNSKGDIRDMLPPMERRGEMVRQTRYDFSHSKREEDFGKVVSGFPLKDRDRHFKLRRKCGDSMGQFLGFMDDGTPVRLNQDTFQRFSLMPNRVWFRLDLDVKGVNKSQCFTGSPDNRSYCAYDIESAKATFTWFCVTKILTGNYPIWANQYDLWQPEIEADKEKYWYALCFAFVLAENRCVVTKFEKDNPVEGAPEIYADNPLSPNNRDSFWNTTLLPYIKDSEKESSYDAAFALIGKVTELYKLWNKEYCKGQVLEHVGLDKEAYFKYFSYADFVTKDSGLIQIKKYAELHVCEDLQGLLEEISHHTKAVRKELHHLLVDEFKYFR